VYLQIAVIWALAEWSLPSVKLWEWAPPIVTFAILVATYICIPPNCGVPKYDLSQQLLQSEPLDPQRLYLSIYAAPESNYRVEKKPAPVGQLIRPGSTSMWAGLHFINGYSPILPAGVAREFDFRIHGEINLHEAEYLLWNQSGENGLLTQLGVDGLVVSWDSGINPALGPAWEFVASNDEASVYHRIGAPFQRVRSVESIDTHPEMKFAPASISEITDSRNWVSFRVDVPNGGVPALLTFSRPFFRGYQAKLGSAKLFVDSYRDLFPIVQIPPGSHGRVVLTYRPTWLVVGALLSMFCAFVWVIGIFAAVRHRTK
jgi:hypothetical protein